MLRSVPVPPDPKPLKEAKVIKKLGNTVRVISWNREGEKKTREINGIDIDNFSLRASYGSGVKNLIKMLLWQLFLIYRLSFAKFDVVHSFDLDTALPAYIVSRIKRKKIVYEVLDAFYISRKLPNSLRGIAKKLEEFIANHSDAFIIVDDRRKKQLSVKKNPYILYNTVEDIYPLNCRFKRRKENLASYVGVLHEDRGIRQIIEVARRMPSWEFWIAGYGPLETFVRESANRIRNMTFFGKVPYETALNIEGCSDVIMAVYDPDVASNKFSSPNKLYEATMLGVPLVVSKGTGIDEIVNQNEIGLSVNYSDVEELIKALENIKKCKERFGKNARKVYLEKFSWDKFENTLTNIYATLK